MLRPPRTMDRRVDLRRRGELNVKSQIDIALKAFRTNGYFIVINDRQVTDLVEEITVTPKTAIVFFRLIPLVGG